MSFRRSRSHEDFLSGEKEFSEFPRTLRRCVVFWVTAILGGIPTRVFDAKSPVYRNVQLKRCHGWFIYAFLNPRNCWYVLGGMSLVGWQQWIEGLCATGFARAPFAHLHICTFAGSTGTASGTPRNTNDRVLVRLSQIHEQ